MTDDTVQKAIERLEQDGAFVDHLHVGEETPITAELIALMRAVDDEWPGDWPELEALARKILGAIEREVGG